MNRDVIQAAAKRFRDISLKNKIFFSIIEKIFFSIFEKSFFSKRNCSNS